MARLVVFFGMGNTDWLPIERAARAVHHCSFSDRAWEDLTPDWKERYAFTARAVISAIRKPTIGMLSAGLDAIEAQPDDADDIYTAEVVWPAMIDALLGELSSPEVL